MKPSKGLTKLVELVKDEAKKLRKYATQRQKDKLDFGDLSALSPQRCIYGQMTGTCYSREALDLIRKCALRVYNTDHTSLYGITLKHLNGAPKDFEYATDRKGEYHSPIEIFIAKMSYSDNDADKDNNQILIDYLKGKTKTLKFDFNKKRAVHSW